MTYTEKILKDFDDLPIFSVPIIEGVASVRTFVVDVQIVKDFLATKLQQAIAEERERAHRLVKLYGTPNCDYLHHNKKQQHEGGEICPVVTEITDLLSSQDKTKE